MKQRISTIACGFLLLCFMLPTLQAQQNVNETKTITAVQTVTDATGATITTTETITSGLYFEEVVQQLGLDQDQQKAVKIHFMEDDVHQTTLEGDTDEETVFFFRAAKSEADQDDLEKLHITVGDKMDVRDDDKKPLLGVYTERKDDHVEITGIVHESGAEKAGLQKGDLLVAIESDEIHNSLELREAIQKHEVGDVVSVKYIRQGQEGTMMVTLGEKKDRNYHQRNRVYSYHYDYNDNHYRKSYQDRNPCDVFIGIYTSSNRRGLKVHNIIANTPAANSTIEKGDIVQSFNYVPVDSHRELVTERDKSEPGDYFTVTVLRDGETVNIDMQFDDCPIEEEDLIENMEESGNIEMIQNDLDIRNFSAFPNPTYGPVTLKFEGAAAPTTIRIIDAAGKTVYQEEIINFDGYYNKDIELERAVPGTLILTVTQDQKVYTESMVFMPRA